MPRTSGSKKTRFSLWLPDEIRKELSQRQEATGKSSVAEVIREAVEVYRSLLQAKEAGMSLFYEDDSGQKGRIWLLPGPLPVRRPKR